MSAQREFIQKRARWRCEYCCAPQEVTGYNFHVEHILPRGKGGKTNHSNCALACANCNFSKSNHLTAPDPKTGKQERLFNPRSDEWEDHFVFHRANLKISGKTPTGRATVTLLQMNSVRQLEARALWVELQVYP
jgi:HNH endonuclease